MHDYVEIVRLMLINNLEILRLFDVTKIILTKIILHSLNDNEYLNLIATFLLFGCDIHNFGIVASK